MAEWTIFVKEGRKKDSYLSEAIKLAIYRMGYLGKAFIFYLGALTNLKFYTALRVGKEASSKDRIDAKIHKRYPSCTNPATNGDTQPFEGGDRAWHSSNLLFVDRHFPHRLGCWDHRSRPC